MTLLNQDDPSTHEGEVTDAVIGRAFRASLAVMAVVAAAAGSVAWYWSRPVAVPTTGPAAIALPTRREAAALPMPKVVFTDVTKTAGITFVHQNGADGEKLLPETMGAGVAFLDYDRDGRADLFFVNGTAWPGRQAPSGRSPTLALYRNKGDGTFENVTERAGLAVAFQGMGVAAGDYDNDGWVDLYVTAVGSNHLFRNEQGTFRDVTATANVAGDATQWSSGAAFADIDRDGDLDLFVANYLTWSRDLDLAQGFTLTGNERAYGPPRSFAGTFPALYRNDGGRFVDISVNAGIHVRSTLDQPMAKSLGVLPCDLDGDGWIDLVVANDTVANFVFHNQKDGTFREVGQLSGVAFDNTGNARGAMGIDASWFRNDSTLGIAIGNFANEMTALYVTRDQSMQFNDDALASGLGPPTRQALTFAVLFLDFDLDGRPDLFCANGHLENEINKVQPSQHYEQPPQLFWNAGPESPSEFVLMPPERVGSDLSRPLVGRGAAFADMDNDGDLDLVITSCGGSPRLLRNDHAMSHHWLRVKLVGKPEQGINRDGIGAVVTLRSKEGAQRQQVMPTRGYLSQSELPLTFGLGAATRIDRLDVHWPNGSTETWTDIPADQMVTLEPGTAPSSASKP